MLFNIPFSRCPTIALVLQLHCFLGNSGSAEDLWWPSCLLQRQSFPGQSSSCCHYGFPSLFQTWPLNELDWLVCIAFMLQCLHVPQVTWWLKLTEIPQSALGHILAIHSTLYQSGNHVKFKTPKVCLLSLVSVGSERNPNQICRGGRRSWAPWQSLWAGQWEDHDGGVDTS